MSALNHTKYGPADDARALDALARDMNSLSSLSPGQEATGRTDAPAGVPLTAIGPRGFRVDHRGQPVEWTPPRANVMPPSMADAEFHDPASSVLTWLIALAPGFLCGVAFAAGVM